MPARLLFHGVLGKLVITLDYARCRARAGIAGQVGGVERMIKQEIPEIKEVVAV